jgi:polyvinyl alcohol dehydrogenase (cytochrome)
LAGCWLLESLSPQSPFLLTTSTKDGSIIWDFNSGAHTFEAVNGAKAKGGMMNAGGPVVVRGVLYVNAGYVGIQGQPGMRCSLSQWMENR